jgi:hypothetical protein
VFGIDGVRLSILPIVDLEASVVQQLNLRSGRFYGKNLVLCSVSDEPITTIDLSTHLSKNRVSVVAVPADSNVTRKAA